MKNTFVKVLSFLMALTMIVGTLGTVVVFAADCTHENATAGEVVAPKCNAVGYTWYTCDDCGASFKDDYVPVTGKHVIVEKFDKGQSAEPTCTTPGYIPGQWCTDCETWIKRPVADTVNKPFKKHSFGAGTITTKKYCTDDVYLVFNCTGCGKPSHELKNAANASTFAPATGYPERVLLEEGAADCDWGDYVVKTTPVLECDSTVVEKTCKVCAKVETYTTPVKHSWDTFTAPAELVQNKEYCGEFLSYNFCVYCGVKDKVKTNPDRQNHGKEKIVALTTELRNDVTFVNWCNANGKNYLSLEIGGLISKEPSCYEEGYYVYYCALCNEYREEKQGMVAHDTEYKEYDGSTDGVCAPAKNLYSECKNYETCKYRVFVSEITPAKQHVANNPVVVKPKCTESGSTTVSCKNCSKVLSQTFTTAVGHTWDAYYYSNSTGTKVTKNDCKEGIYRTRLCKVCGAMDKVETLVEKCEDHLMSTGSDYKIRPATCSDGEYGYFYCKNSDLCNVLNKEDYVVEGTVDEDKRDPANHTPYVSTMVELKGKYVHPTCTTKGKLTYVCACDVELTRDVPANGHKEYDKNTRLVGKSAIVSNQLIEKDFNGDGKIEKVDVRYVDAKCNVVGYDAGEACTICGTITKARVNRGLEATDHSGPRTEREVVDATCLKAGYIIYQYDSCCDIKVTVARTDAPHDKPLTSCDINTIKVYEGKAPDCTEVGYHAYTICTVCKKITVAEDAIDGCKNLDKDGKTKCSAEVHEILARKIERGVVTEADLKIAATGHDFSTKVEAKPAWCETWRATLGNDVDGYTEYYKCANAGCEEHTAYSIIRAHTRTTKAYNAKAVTCFADGLNAGQYCPICIDIKGTPDYNAAHITKRNHVYGSIVEDGDNYIFVNVKTYDRANNKITRSIDCTEPAYILKVCQQNKCGHVEMLEGTYVDAKAAHNWSAVTYEHKVVTEEKNISADETYACWASSYTYRKCADCEQESDKAYKNDQIKHYYYVAGEKVEIDLNCENIAKYEGVRCALCGNEVKATEDAKKTYVKGEHLGAIHTYKQDLVNAKYDKATAKWIPTSCTEYGYVSEYCVVCKKDKVDTVTVNPYNPTLNPYDDKGDERADIIKAIVDKKDATADAAGYVKYVCAYCNETHNYVLPALGGLEFSVVPSASKVAAGTKLDLVVKVKANADVAFNSLVLNLNLGNLFTIAGEPTLNYTFAGSNMVLDASASSVKIYAEHDANGKPVNVTIKAGEVVEFITVTVEANEFANGTSGELEATLSNVVKYKADGKTTEAVDVSVSKGAKNKVTVCGVGNLNGDATIAGVSDIQQLIHLVYNESTDAIADINRDGVVNGKDITALRTFSTSAQKALDYITMIGVDLDAAIAAANVPNMDKNGVIDVNDEILFANAIKNELAAMTCAEYFAKNYASIDDCILSLTIKLITPVTPAP